MKLGKAAAVVDGIRQKITSGQYEVGQRLPSVPELMVEYEVASRSTIDRALRDLAAEGFVDVRHGLGSYVRAREAIRRNLAENLRLEYRRAITGDTDEGLFESMTGIHPDRIKVDMAVYARTAATDRCADLLGVAPGDPLLVRTYRYRLDGHPHQVARSAVTVEMAERLSLTGPEVEQKGLGTIARLHAVGIDPTSATIEITARRPSTTESAELAIPANAPVVEVFRVLYAGQAPVELSTSVVRADDIRYYLNVELTEEPR